MANQIAYFYTVVFNFYPGSLFFKDIKTGDAIFSVRESPTKIYYIHTNIYLCLYTIIKRSHVIL